MGVEIERKFLVKGSKYRESAIGIVSIRQAYLSMDPMRIIRVRISDEKGFIGIKTKAEGASISRQEWEYEIPLEDALDILPLCKSSLIEKTRFVVRSGSHQFEVDEFHGRHEGLVIAEIELSSEDETFSKPSWLGEEVTSDPAYYNSTLAG